MFNFKDMFSEAKMSTALPITYLEKSRDMYNVIG